jgi:hypothetical protein
MNREMYQEDDVIKNKSIDIDLLSLPTKLGFEEMIRVLAEAGYETSSFGFHIFLLSES